jgi:DNA polymerase III epsilon subunit-like protein
MTSWKDGRIAFIDTETTGLDARRDHVWELAVITVEQRKIVGNAVEQFNPGVTTLHPKITDITGIKLEDFAAFPTFVSRAENWQTFIESHEFCASYNTVFDLPFVTALFARAGRKLAPRTWFDPLLWARHFETTLANKRLGTVCQHLGIDLTNAHCALDDAHASAQVMLHYFPRLPDDLDEMQALQDEWFERYGSRRR